MPYSFISKHIICGKLDAPSKKNGRARGPAIKIQLAALVSGLHAAQPFRAAAQHFDGDQQRR